LSLDHYAHCWFWVVDRQALEEYLL
jgi:hypothetical protein